MMKPANLWNEDIESEILEMFSDLIKLKTINSCNNEREAVDYIAGILNNEGINYSIIEPKEGRGNIVAVLEGGSEPPLLLLSHLDVVDVVEDKWSHPPFSAEEQDGMIYGRGALDTKQLTVMGLITLLLLHRSGEKPNRDVIFIATADEENGSKYGMKYLSENYPQFLPKGYVINEGGGFVLFAGDKKFRTCASAEKGVCEVKVTVPEEMNGSPHDPAAHNLNKIAKVIENITSYSSDRIMCDVSRSFQELVGDHLEENITLKNLWEYMVHNTMTVNKFNFSGQVNDKGEFDPMRPREITLNFRFIPGASEKEVMELIENILVGTDVDWEITRFETGYESCLDNEFIKTLEKKSRMYDQEKDVELLPVIALGNTDGRFIQHNVYGYSPLLGDVPFDQVLKKVHAHDECITRESLLYGCKVIFNTAWCVSY